MSESKKRASTIVEEDDTESLFDTDEPSTTTPAPTSKSTKTKRSKKSKADVDTEAEAVDPQSSPDVPNYDDIAAETKEAMDTSAVDTSADDLRETLQQQTEEDGAKPKTNGGATNENAERHGLSKDDAFDAELNTDRLAIKKHPNLTLVNSDYYAKFDDERVQWRMTQSKQGFTKNEWFPKFLDKQYTNSTAMVVSPYMRLARDPDWWCLPEKKTEGGGDPQPAQKTGNERHAMRTVRFSCLTVAYDPQNEITPEQEEEYKTKYPEGEPNKVRNAVYRYAGQDVAADDYANRWIYDMAAGAVKCMMGTKEHRFKKEMADCENQWKSVRTSWAKGQAKFKGVTDQDVLDKAYEEENNISKEGFIIKCFVETKMTLPTFNKLKDESADAPKTVPTFIGYRRKLFEQTATYRDAKDLPAWTDACVQSSDLLKSMKESGYTFTPPTVVGPKGNILNMMEMVNEVKAGAIIRVIHEVRIVPSQGKCEMSFNFHHIKVFKYHIRRSLKDRTAGDENVVFEDEEDEGTTSGSTNALPSGSRPALMSGDPFLGFLTEDERKTLKSSSTALVTV